MAYDWMDPHWIVQAEAAERWARPALTQRRWTDKDDVMSDYVLKGEWPTIPKGVGADFEGERALRVFLEITDGDEAHEAPEEALLVAKLSGDDAARAGLTAADEFLVVPVKFFVWVAGALSFDKKVLLLLKGPIAEHRLDHKDVEDVWPNLVWIAPMKGADRKYYYAVLPLVGMGGVIDPQKGTPSIFAPLQADPLRNIVYDVIDEIIDGGISAWGQGATSGDGAASIFTIKLRLVNFLRNLANAFVEEEFGRMQRRGEFDRGTVAKAIANGLFRHLPDDQRIAKEKEWLDVADGVTQVRVGRCAYAGMLFGFGGAVSAILRGFGEGWADDLQTEADRLSEVAWHCDGRGKFLKWLGRARWLGIDDPTLIAEKAQEAYLDGDISPHELAAIEGAVLDEKLQPGIYEVDADKEKIKEVLEEFKWFEELEWFLGDQYPK